MIETLRAPTKAKTISSFTALSWPTEEQAIGFPTAVAADVAKDQLEKGVIPK